MFEWIEKINIFKMRRDIDEIVIFSSKKLVDYDMRIETMDILISRLGKIVSRLDDSSQKKSLETLMKT